MTENTKALVNAVFVAFAMVITLMIVVAIIRTATLPPPPIAMRFVNACLEAVSAGKPLPTLCEKVLTDAANSEVQK